MKLTKTTTTTRIIIRHKEASVEGSADLKVSRCPFCNSEMVGANIAERDHDREGPMPEDRNLLIGYQNSIEGESQ
ncbi:MAG: hypothetical protein JNL64_02740 [Blastocatellia bacterium]|nr:hypothetical protein [Blastocatellia bacterium]